MLFGKRGNRDGVIRFEDSGRNLVLYRYGSDGKDLMLLPGTRIEVAESQAIAFMTGNELADVFDKGSYLLTPENFPRLAEKTSFRLRPIRPIRAELYYINLDPITERKWATRSPALVWQDGQHYQLRAYGTYDFQVTDPIPFMLEMFRNHGLQSTYEVVSFLPTLLAGAFASVVGELKMPVAEVVNHAWTISDLVCAKASQSAAHLGLEFLHVTIEGASLPDVK